MIRLSEMCALAQQLERELIAARSESGQRDAERLDHLAEITNLATLQESGHMLTGEQARQIAKTAKALSVGYELHRRTNDTPQAFRFAVDDAMRGK